jgi:drug/metabolite transporter (DMT)-like permease
MHKPAARPETRPFDLIGVVSLVFCCVVWGVNQVAFKIANEGISPMFQAGLRSLMVAVMLLGWAWGKGIRMFARDRSLLPGLLVGLAFTGNFLFIGPGLDLTEASRGVLFYYTAPFFVALGAHRLIPGERLTWIRSLGFACAFLGLVVTVSERLGSGANASLLGDLYCLVAGVFWAATTLLVRTTSLAWVAPEKGLFYQLAVSAPLLVAAAWLFGEPGVTDFSPRVAVAFAYTVLIVVFISYVVWFWVLTVYPASQASVFTFTAPIFAVIAGHLILDEPVTWRLAVALVLVAGGIFIVNKPQLRA